MEWELRVTIALYGRSVFSRLPFLLGGSVDVGLTDTTAFYCAAAVRNKSRKCYVAVTVI
jgi:hypothetical protein